MRPGCDGTWTWPAAAQLTRSRPSSLRRPSCARAARRSWPRSRTSRSPARCRAARARRSSRRRRSCWPARPTSRPSRRRGDVRAVRRRLQEAEEPAGQLRHQRLQAQVDVDAPTSRSRPTRPASPTSRRAACATSARPCSAPSPTARCAAARRAARRPGPGRAAISSTPASPASRCPRRRRACARAASTSTASSRTSSGPAAGPTCKRTWTDKRGAQLARAVRGKTGDPYPHYCAECEKELGELEDRQVPCKTDHCTGTWTWTSAQQLAAGVRPVVKDEKDEARQGAARRRAAEAAAEARRTAPRREAARRARRRQTAPRRRPRRAGRRPAGAQGQGKAARAAGATASAGARPRPPERRCEACIEFLKDRKTHEIPCSTCATPQSTGRRRASCRPTSATGPSRRCAARASATRPRRRAPLSARPCAIRRCRARLRPRWRRRLSKRRLSRRVTLRRRRPVKCMRRCGAGGTRPVSESPS